MTNVTVPNTDDVAEWFARNLLAAGRNPARVTDDHARCLRTLSAITAPSGLYNLPTPCGVTDGVSLWPHGAVSAIVHGELATFDFARLTRLVVAAHRDHVRIAIGPWVHHRDRERATAVARWMSRDYGTRYRWDSPAVGCGIVEIMLHPREPDGDHPLQRHPGLADLAAMCTP